MSTNCHPAFFGYGSLVNRATHDHAPAVPATLTGWRRVWRPTPRRALAFLSAEPAEGEIDGLVAAVPGDDWALLDRREAAYARAPLPDAAIASAPGWASRIDIYAIAPTGKEEPAPILLSYLDTVVQGFLAEFGEDGVSRFFATTAHWGPLVDDRAAPRYPRHQGLRGTERLLVDHHTGRLGLPRLDPESII